jgi:hypothetical protein
VKKPEPPVELMPRGPSAEVEHADDPPVVARLVVEIRSDGSRTIARGAIEDVARDLRTSIEARGTSPLQLALALAKQLSQIPRMAHQLTGRSTLGTVRALLGSRRRDKAK